MKNTRMEKSFCFFGETTGLRTTGRGGEDAVRTAEVRKHPRYDHCSRIQYARDQGPHQKVSQGVTNNISLGGLRLFVMEPLEEGLRIKIMSDLPVERRIAISRWMKKLDEGLFETGLMFVDEK